MEYCIHDFKVDRHQLVDELLSLLCIEGLEVLDDVGLVIKFDSFKDWNGNLRVCRFKKRALVLLDSETTETKGKKYTRSWGFARFWRDSRFPEGVL